MESVTWLVMSCVVRLRRCCDHAVEARGWVEEALPSGGAVDLVHT